MNRLAFVLALVCVAGVFMAFVAMGAAMTDTADYVEWSREEQSFYRDRTISGCLVLTAPFLLYVVGKRLAFLHFPRWWTLPIGGLILLPSVVGPGSKLSDLIVLMGLVGLYILVIARPRVPHPKAHP